MAADALGVTLGASNGWLQNFLRRSPAQPSFNLYEKVGTALPLNSSKIMKDIQDIAGQFQPSNIYNMDNSGLVYRIGSHRTYLMADESRSHTSATEFSKQKERVTIDLCFNADESHIMLIMDIEKSAKTRSFSHATGC